MLPLLNLPFDGSFASRTGRTEVPRCVSGCLSDVCGSVSSAHPWWLTHLNHPPVSCYREEVFVVGASAQRSRSGAVDLLGISKPTECKPSPSHLDEAINPHPQGGSSVYVILHSVGSVRMEHGVGGRMLYCCWNEKWKNKMDVHDRTRESDRIFSHVEPVHGLDGEMLCIFFQTYASKLAALALNQIYFCATHNNP